MKTIYKVGIAVSAWVFIGLVTIPPIVTSCSSDNDKIVEKATESGLLLGDSTGPHHHLTIRSRYTVQKASADTTMHIRARLPYRPSTVVHGYSQKASLLSKRME